EDAPRPLWIRPALSEIAEAPAPEKGLYGTPTLPDGRRQELAQRDVRVSAPLSVALDARPRLRRIAVADYPGWQRWVRSSATLADRPEAPRWGRARPPVRGAGGGGSAGRGCGPGGSARRGWVPPVFWPGGRRLPASPPPGPARGGGGRAPPPADDDARSLEL